LNVKYLFSLSFVISTLSDMQVCCMEPSITEERRQAEYTNSFSRKVCQTYVYMFQYVSLM